MSGQERIKYSQLLELYKGLLTDNQRDIFEMYYNSDMSLYEIAECLSITKQGVRDSIKKTEKILERYENVLECSRKRDEVKQLINRLEAKEIEVDTFVGLLIDLI